MELTIDHNVFRLMCKGFIILLPLKGGKVKLNGKYTIKHAKYEKLGVVECIERRDVQLMMVSDTMIRISEGEGYKERMHKQFVFNTDIIQCCVFHFVRRFDGAFNKMIVGEMPKIGLTVIQQTQLFQS